MKSDFEKVQEFNKGTGQECPEGPSSMNKDEVLFLSKMMLDEIMEFMVTVIPSNEYKSAINKMVSEAEPLEFKELSEDELCAEQGDALVDSYYYSLNAAAKKGINLSKIFQVVHGANMDKRDKKSGEFLKRSDGKIIKPEGWSPPDIVKVIKDMKEHDNHYCGHESYYLEYYNDVHYPSWRKYCNHCSIGEDGRMPRPTEEEIEKFAKEFPDIFEAGEDGY